MNEAVIAKIKARRAKSFTISDYEHFCENPEKIHIVNLTEDFAAISPYLNKTAKDFIREFIKEMADDIFFPSNLKSLNAQDKSTIRSLKRIFGIKADLLNILWLYRLRRFFNICGDRVFSFLSPQSHRLGAEEIRRLVYAKSLDDFVHEVANGSYGHIFAKLSDFRRGEQIVSNSMRRAFQKESENLAMVCGYFFSRHLENKNLNVVSQGVKNNFSTQEILELLH